MLSNRASRKQEVNYIGVRPFSRRNVFFSKDDEGEAILIEIEIHC